MDYDRILTLLARRYVKHGVCRDCGRRGWHDRDCELVYYARQILDRALREKGRAA